MRKKEKGLSPGRHRNIHPLIDTETEIGKEIKYEKYSIIYIPLTAAKKAQSKVVEKKNKKTTRIWNEWSEYRWRREDEELYVEIDE